MKENYWLVKHTFVLNAHKMKNYYTKPTKKETSHLIYNERNLTELVT